MLKAYTFARISHSPRSANDRPNFQNIYIYTGILIRVTQVVQEGQKNDDEVRLYVRKTNRLLYNIYIYLSFNCILKYNRNN